MKYKLLMISTVLLALLSSGWVEAAKKSKKVHIKAKTACEKALEPKLEDIDYASLFSISNQFKHDARLVASSLNIDEVRKDLSAITGRIKIDCEGCIDGRYTDGQKQRVRQFLMARLEGMGLEPVIQEHIYEKRRKFPKRVNRYALFDVSSASDRNLKEYWNSINCRDLRNYLVDEQGLADKFTTLKALTVESIDEIIAAVEVELKVARQKQKVEQSRKIKNSLSDEIIYLKYVIADSRKIKEGLKRGLEAKAKKEPEFIESKAINVIVEIKGSKYPEQVIEVNAHYDTTAEDRPGADDNGSGVSTLLQIANIFTKYKPKRTIRLVFADLEEFGFHGTDQHVKSLVKNKEEILAALVVDTIGYAPISGHNDLKPNFVMEVGLPKDHKSQKTFSKVKAITEVLAYQHAKYTDRYVNLRIDTAEAKPFTADHGPYWLQDVPAVLVAAPFEGDAVNPGYHLKADVLEQYNWGYFEAVAKFIIEGLALATETSLTKAQRVKAFKEVLGEEYVEEVLEESADYLTQRYPVPKKKKRIKKSKIYSAVIGYGFNESDEDEDDYRPSKSKVKKDKIDW